MIAPNKVVSIEYEVFNQADNALLDSNKGGSPLEFLVGSGQIISGLENALIGANVGDNIKATIQPEDAYGTYQSDFVQEVPREQFENIDLKAGMTVFGQSEDGQVTQVSVKDFNDKFVIIDYNHPLAGKTLDFDVKVLDVREPTEMEILQGGVGGGCGCGSGEGHHHGGGGCCGGGGHAHGGGGCGCGH
ncbi:peptidylprolyl isomerase [Helicobacter jaachi]|uniref:Peptidyl-prolyl cis-trans isomerase n=1 Tax=Helicobacter jaachi TaxID=1677920 RepID=A0A4U8T8N0_9HELI|nr:peptidylprolyl isomerase [Helicobacter jaachi]TLD96041.1 peptidylprolyl isomerase [Helicobacter jaachi]